MENTWETNAITAGSRVITLENFFHLRNGPDKNESNNGNEHVGMQKRC